MVRVSPLLTTVMGHETAQMAVMRLDVVVSSGVKVCLIVVTIINSHIFFMSTTPGSSCINTVQTDLY